MISGYHEFKIDIAFKTYIFARFHVLLLFLLSFKYFWVVFSFS